MDTDGQGVLEFPIGEKFYPMVLFSESRLKQEFGVYHGIFGKTIQISDVDDRKDFLKWRAKPPFGKATLERHLPSFKTCLRPPPSSSILAFASSACSLPVAGSNSSAHAFPLLPCSRWWFQFFQYHPRSLSDYSITSTKWITRLIIPRISGRSGKRRV
jgi:hypothetical protein